MKTVEFWRWRYRDPSTGMMCRTTFPMSVDEAIRSYPDPVRVEGSMTRREVVDECAETTPDVFRHHAPQR
ncbi:MAG: hypothetical protein ABIV63_03410 [Caldimonas sp.]